MTARRSSTRCAPGSRNMCGQACPDGASIGIADDAARPFQQVKALMQATTQTAKNGFLRAAALAVSIAGTLFWLYTFYGIAQVPAGDGSGFQWIAVMPLGFVFIAFTLPALILALRG